MASCTLYPGKEKRVLDGHPWVFRSDIKKTDSEAQPGCVVRVYAGNGRYLGQAFYNPQSQITLRFLTHGKEPVDGAFIRERVFRAVAYRRLFADLRSCRLIFSESDGLPGLIVDAFGDVLCAQFLCLGIDRFREDVLDALEEAMSPAAIYERSDAPVRELEGLAQTAGLLRGVMPERVEIVENGVHFLVDVREGQKTGYFLDQKENRAAIAPFVRDREVLDCFTHTGAFALHAAHYGAKSVTAVDISGYACDCARKNAELNGFEQIEFVTANAFDYLKEKSLSGPCFDVVILDPPAFTKSRATVDAAARGYKEINLRGMKLVRPGGYLVTCSCSQHMSPEAFLAVVKDAAKDARVSLMQAEYRTQGRDHPILPAAPETQYLKCGIFRVDAL